MSEKQPNEVDADRIELLKEVLARLRYYATHERSYSQYTWLAAVARDMNMTKEEVEQAVVQAESLGLAD